MKNIQFSLAIAIWTALLMSCQRNPNASPAPQIKAQIEFVVNNNMTYRRLEDNILVKLNLSKVPRAGGAQVLAFDTTFQMSSAYFNKQIRVKKNIPIDLGVDDLNITKAFEISYGTLNHYKYIYSEYWQKNANVYTVYLDIKDSQL